MKNDYTTDWQLCNSIPIPSVNPNKARSTLFVGSGAGNADQTETEKGSKINKSEKGIGRRPAC